MPVFVNAFRIKLTSPVFRYAVFALSTLCCGWAIPASNVLAQSMSAATASAAPYKLGARPQNGFIRLETVDANWEGLTEKQKFSVVSQLVRNKQFEDAERLLLKSRFRTSDQHVASRFLLGMIKKGKGEFEEAIAIFRDILAALPRFTEARIALAQTLFEKQEDESAKHHLQLILSETASSPGLNRLVRSYIGAIDRRRRWGLSAYFTLAPSTNFNQGSDSSKVHFNGLDWTLDEKNQKKSGIGITAGLQGSYRQPVTARLDVIATAGVHTKRYKEEDFNDLLVSASLGPRYRFDWGTLGLYATGDKRWSADVDHDLGFGGLFAAQVRLSPTDIANIDVYCTKRNYDTDYLGDDLSYQDGNLCGISVRHDHYFNAASFIRGLGSVGEERTETTHLNNRSWSIGLGAYREMPFGISLYSQLRYSKRRYEGIYPSSDVSRNDDRYDVSVNITKRNWNIFGLAPQLQYTYTFNDSNVGFHDYDAHGVNMTMTKNF